MLVAPIFQILLFVYIGRSAALEDDAFYVVGNAIQYAAVPCLFAMIFTIAGERHQQTLGYLLVTPAARLPLFLGRAIPVVLNGFVVAAFSLVVGSLIVGVDIAASSYPALLFAALVSAFGCTGFGLLGAGVGLLVREQAVLANVLFGLLLVFTGANVPSPTSPAGCRRFRGAPVHARDRGGAADRGRRGARRRERAARPGGARRPRLHGPGVRVHPHRGACEPPLRDPGAGMSQLRLLTRTIRFQVKTLTLSSFFLLIAVLQPMIFATIAFYMFEAGGSPRRCSTSRSVPGSWARGRRRCSAPAA